MANHEDPTGALRETAQLLGLIHVGRDWLLDEHVLAVLEGGLHQPMMRAGRRRHDHRVDVRIDEDRLGVGPHLHIRETRPHQREPCGVAVDHAHDLARLPVVEVADEVWPPLPGTDDSDADHLRSPRPT